MEEKRPGQAPDQEQFATDPRTAGRTRPPGASASATEPSPAEKAMIAAADRQAQAAAREMRARGFGDDKGSDGF